MAITLYEDKQLKITSGEGIGEKITENLFYIKNKNEKPVYYAIPIRFMNESFKIPRGKLESKLDEINPKIKESLKKANINIDSAHLAMCLATYQFWELVRADRDSERMSFMR